MGIQGIWHLFLFTQVEFEVGKAVHSSVSRDILIVPCWRRQFLLSVKLLVSKMEEKKGKTPGSPIGATTNKFQDVLALDRGF